MALRLVVRLKAMKAPTIKQAANFICGPWMIIPIAFFFAMLSFIIYGDPPEMHGDLERALFLQGNTDLGGGTLFAATIGLYVGYGFTAAWYLLIQLSAIPRTLTFSQRLIKSLWIMKFHILAFGVGGTAHFGYDARVTPNDFRNLFLFVSSLYIASMLLIVYLNGTEIPLIAKFALAPLFTILWLIIGSDGNTARAGQLVQSGQDPQPIIRSYRHSIMLSWHRICDNTLGDITK